MRTCEKPITNAIFFGRSLELSLEDLNKFLKESNFGVKILEKTFKKKETKTQDKKRDEKVEKEQLEEEKEDSCEIEFMYDEEEIQEEKEKKEISNIIIDEKKKTEKEEPRKLPNRSLYVVKGNETTIWNLAMHTPSLLEYIFKEKDDKSFTAFAQLEDAKFQTLLSEILCLLLTQKDNYKDRTIFSVSRIKASDSFRRVIHRKILETIEDISGGSSTFLDQILGIKPKIENLGDSDKTTKIDRYKYYSKKHSIVLSLLIFCSNYDLPTWDKNKKEWFFNIGNKKKHKSPKKNEMSKKVLVFWNNLMLNEEENLTKNEMYCILDIVCQEWLKTGVFLFGSVKGLYDHFFETVLIPFMKLFGGLSKFKTSPFEKLNKEQNDFLDQKTKKGNKNKC